MEKAYKKKFEELLKKQNFYDIENFVNVNVGNKYTFFSYYKNAYVKHLYPISIQYVCKKYSQIQKYLSNDKFLNLKPKILTQYVYYNDLDIKDYNDVDFNCDCVDKQFLLNKLNYGNLISLLKNSKKICINIDDFYHMYKIFCSQIEKDFQNMETRTNIFESVLFCVKEHYLYYCRIYDREKPSKIIWTSEITYTKYLYETICHDKKIYYDGLYVSFMIMLILTNNIKISFNILSYLIRFCFFDFILSYHPNDKLCRTYRSKFFLKFLRNVIFCGKLII